MCGKIEKNVSSSNQLHVTVHEVTAPFALSFCLFVFDSFHSLHLCESEFLGTLFVCNIMQLFTITAVKSSVVCCCTVISRFAKSLKSNGLTSAVDLTCACARTLSTVATLVPEAHFVESLYRK